MIIIILVFCVCIYGAYHIINNQHKNNRETYYSYFNHIYNQERFRFDCLSAPSKLYTYCIYIPEREEYIRDLFIQFNQQNICFFRGFEPSQLSEETYSLLSGINLFFNKMYKQKSKLCVHLSYMMCIYHAIKNNHEYICIFEDDIYFTEPYEQLYRVYMDFVKLDYDVCFLGYCYCKKCNKILDTSSRLTLLPSKQQVLCKHAMIYKVSYLKKIWYDLLPLYNHSDRVFLKSHHKWNAKLSIVNKPFIFQDRKKFQSRNNNHGKGSLFC